MGDEDEDDPSPSVRDVLFDGTGTVHWGRAVDAIRGRGTDDTDLAPLLVVGLLVAVVGGPLLGFVEYGNVAQALEAGWWLFAYVVLALVVTLERIEEYYSEDEEVAIEELRSQYAEGDIDLEEFQRRVDRVYEEGPGTVWAEEDSEDTGDRDEVVTGDRDPAAILRERYARGEIDEAEFRRRMEVLGEPVGAAPATERPVETET